MGIGIAHLSLVVNGSVEESMNGMKKTTDHEHMRAEMDQLISAIELPELNKQFRRRDGWSWSFG